MSNSSAATEPTATPPEVRVLTHTPRPEPLDRDAAILRSGHRGGRLLQEQRDRILSA